MKDLLLLILGFIPRLFWSRASLEAEVVALRHQLAIYERLGRRPQIKPADRIFWSWLSRVWPGWRGALVFVQPETVIAWRRRKFREHWRKLSRQKSRGRPVISDEVRDLIRRMSMANPLWGSPKIVGELKKLGIDVAPSTVAKYRVRKPGPRSQGWGTFLRNHLRDFVSIDFFTVSTARFKVLFVLVVLLHFRRRVVHFNVTENPTAEWTAQQIVEAFPWEAAPKRLLRDRDRIYGEYFSRRVKNMGIREVLITAKSPWQNPYVERLIGCIRQECLDHVIILDERHLRRVLKGYFEYHQQWRTHLSLEMDCPQPRAVQEPAKGEVIEFPEVGGLHHHYERLAA
jgi:hypothetical protein